MSRLKGILPWLLPIVLLATLGCWPDDLDSPVAPDAERQAIPSDVTLAVLHGQVTSELGAPLAGVTVFLRVCVGDSQDGEHLFEDVTDKLGNYSIPDIPPGLWDLVAHTEHYVRYEADVVIPETGHVEQDIVLASACNGPGGRAEEASGNNLSLPAIWSDGYELTLRGVFGEPMFLGAFTTDASLVDWFHQQDALNEWQAGTADWSASPVFVDWVDWGDNLESKYWPIRSKIRVETVLYQDLAEPMTTFEMSWLFGEGPDEMWGCNAVSFDGYEATVYSHCARMTIQRLVDGYDPATLVWNPSIGEWEGEHVLATVFNKNVWSGSEGPYEYSAEINIPGKVIYGFTWDTREYEDGPGAYRLTFSLDGINAPVALNTFFDAATQIKAAAEEDSAEGEPVGGEAFVDPVNNLTYLDTVILPRGGGGGGGNGGPHPDLPSDDGHGNGNGGNH